MIFYNADYHAWLNHSPSQTPCHVHNTGIRLRLALRPHSVQERGKLAERRGAWAFPAKPHPHPATRLALEKGRKRVLSGKTFLPGPLLFTSLSHLPIPLSLHRYFSSHELAQYNQRDENVSILFQVRLKYRHRQWHRPREKGSYGQVFQGMAGGGAVPQGFMLDTVGYGGGMCG